MTPDPTDRPTDEPSLAAFLAQRSRSGRIVRPGVPTPTVEDAAAAVGTRAERIVKSLVFTAPDDALVLVVAAGHARVDAGALAELLGAPPRAVRLARPERVRRVTGFPVGAMPPFGHRTALPTWIDERTVPKDGEVFAGGGARDALLAIDAAELLELTGDRRAPLTEERAA